MKHPKDPAEAFALAAQVCRTRASALLPAMASSTVEFEVLSGKIEELEILAQIFDNKGLFYGPAPGSDFLH